MQNHKKNIEIIARAVVLRGNKILLCKRIDKDYYFLPGGHVEWGEKAEKALAREMREELGAIVTGTKFIGGSENMFFQDGKEHHEVNIVFYTKLKSAVVKSREDHLLFCFSDTAKLAEENLLPPALKKSLVVWLKDKKTFWIV